jgi:hypothetical protein
MMGEMHVVALMVMLALIEYLIITAMVGSAREI